MPLPLFALSPLPQSTKSGYPRKRDIPLFLLSGGLGFALYMAAFNRASMTVSAATGSVLIATGPILTALAASILLKETLSPGGWAAIAVSFAGILVLTLWDGVFSLNSGVFWMLVAAVSVSGYNLMQRFFKRRYTALQATAYSIWGGTLLMLFQLPHAAAQLLGGTRLRMGNDAVSRHLPQCTGLPFVVGCTVAGRKKPAT